MESFSADWLALREPADHQARAHELTDEVARRLSRHTRTRAVDLACGTGSNVRYLLPRLPHITHWTLVDHDDALLDVARRSLERLARAAGVTIEAVRADLRLLDTLPLDGCALVTASALLDLVSADWVIALASCCRAANADVLLALTYDGRIDCEPGDPLDARVRDLVNQHQHTDKGFGPALGPTAAEAAEAAWAGAQIVVSTSDWVLDGRHVDLQQQLVDGWAGAARQMSPGDSVEIDAWRARRQPSIDAGLSRLRVGHRDIAVWNEADEVTLSSDHARDA